MHYSLRIILAFLLFGLILFQTIVLPLPEGFKAVITHFGKPDRIASEAGPSIRWPWPIDDCYIFVNILFLFIYYLLIQYYYIFF